MDMIMAMHVMIILTGLLSSASPTHTVNVMSLGAKPDGKTDSSKALAAAWSKACSSPSPATIVIPNGRFFLKKAEFTGRCRSSVTFRLVGTLVAPSDYNVIGSGGDWISFRHVDGVTFSGGVLDGQGSSLWACKRSSRNSCPNGATTLGFSNSKNVKILGVTSLNSQLFHIVVNGCEGVRIVGVKVIAPGDSPNTDGIHVQGSSDVAIYHARIGTGDDCISVGPGTRGLWVEDVACGPGHGVSIGSLGREGVEAGVENVTVRWASFRGTQNGLRIKSWARPSTGFARDVAFEHATMDGVDNPILIDQNYCPDQKGCPGGASGVRISRVAYRDVRGTSATQVAVRFECSPAQPCSEISLEDVKLSFQTKPAQASCSHAAGSASGLVQPSSCL